MRKRHQMPAEPLQDFMADVVRELEQRGELANLPGKGKPQYINDNEMTDARAMANRVLKNGAFPPPWAVLKDEIERDIERVEQDIGRAHRYRYTALAQPRANVEAIERGWQAALQSLHARVAEVNRKILKFNLIIPSQLPHLHKPRVQVPATLEKLGIVER